MLLNVSYNNKEIFNSINDSVGKSFSFKDRLKLGGVGSQRFIIREASPRITALLNLDNNASHCNIELRRNGIIIRFRSILETYAWVIPFGKFSLFKSGKTYKFYADDHFMKIFPAFNIGVNQKFFRKLSKLRAEYSEQFSPTNMI